MRISICEITEWGGFCVRATPIMCAHITWTIETNGPLWFSLRLSWRCAKSDPAWSRSSDTVRGIHVAIRTIYVEVDYRIRYNGTRARRDRFHRKQRRGLNSASVKSRFIEDKAQCCETKLSSDAVVHNESVWSVPWRSENLAVYIAESFRFTDNVTNGAFSACNLKLQSNAIAIKTKVLPFIIIILKKHR